jgi:hypothetical protein
MNVRTCVLTGLIAATAATASPAAAADRILHHAIDRTTGAVVRVVQTSTGNRVEVESAGLLVSRQIAATKVTTVIRDQRDELVVSFERGRLTVSSPAGRLSATQAQITQMAAARRLIDAFPGSRKALSLINKLSFGPEVPVLPLLVTTRSFLQAVTTAAVSPVESASFQRRVDAVTGVRLTRAAYLQDSGKKSTDRTPTECWEAYAKEAIAAYMEYEDCVKDLAWYEFLDLTACATIYDVRALGAFSWWMRCVSIG